MLGMLGRALLTTWTPGVGEQQNFHARSAVKAGKHWKIGSEGTSLTLNTKIRYANLTSPNLLEDAIYDSSGMRMYIAQINTWPHKITDSFH